MESKYQRRVKRYGYLAERINQAMKKIVLYKLLAIFGGLGLTVFLFAIKYYFLASGVLIAVLSVYFYLNIRHDKALYLLTVGSGLKDINEAGVKRIQGEWTSFHDKGEDLSEPDHFYAEDLDIVGQGSVFQYMNSCVTPWGRKKLRAILFSHPENIQDIQNRQQAISELAGLLAFRQRLQAEGVSTKGNNDGLDTIFEWGRCINEKLLNPRTQILYRLLPILTAIFLVLGYFRLLPYLIPALLMITQLALLRWKSKDRLKTLNTAYAFRAHLEPFEKMLKQIERKAFTSPLLSGIEITAI